MGSVSERGAGTRAGSGERGDASAVATAMTKPLDGSGTQKRTDGAGSHSWILLRGVRLGKFWVGLLRVTRLSGAIVRGWAERLLVMRVFGSRAKRHSHFMSCVFSASNSMRVNAMRGTMLGVWFLLALGSTSGAFAAQVNHVDGTARHSRKKAHRRATGTSASVPVSVTPGVAGASTDAQQRAADQRLLQQQQATSAEAQRITDQQVKAAQKQHDQLQNEPRIQDAPGPPLTGVVPAAGAPVAPVNTDQRIQDAPGPAQTLPPVTVPSPGQQGVVPPASATPVPPRI